MLKEKYPEAYVLGIDKDLSSILAAKQNYPSCEFFIADILDLRLNNQFDIITFFEAIEHISYHNGIEILNNIKNSVRKYYNCLYYGCRFKKNESDLTCLIMIEELPNVSLSPGQK
jgi:2-polyprenyl-3-methyl-5-hydroxy-6-metoxy-1,4-benzoquinol methylase